MFMINKIINGTIMKKYLLLSLLCLFTIANMHGEGAIGEIGEVGETGITDHSRDLAYELLRASWSNDVSGVKRLIALGADVNEKCYAGWTPLYFAVEANFLTIAQVLIDAGADVNVQDKDNKTPLHIAIGFGHQGHTRMVTLLLNAGSNINIQDNKGNTPLYDAVFWGESEIVELLLEMGADTTIKNNQGETALDNAIAHYNHKITELLRKADDITSWYIKFNNMMRTAVQAASVIIPPVMVAAQIFFWHWIHNRINNMNSDADTRLVTAINLLHEKTFGSVADNVPQLGDLVVDYVGKNID
jgi:hypothetical protein